MKIGQISNTFNIMNYATKQMKAIILSVIAMSLMIGAPSAFAQLGAPHSKNP